MHRLPLQALAILTAITAASACGPQQLDPPPQTSASTASMIWTGPQEAKQDAKHDPCADIPVEPRERFVKTATRSVSSVKLPRSDLSVRVPGGTLVSLKALIAQGAACALAHVTIVRSPFAGRPYAGDTVVLPLNSLVGEVEYQSIRADWVSQLIGKLDTTSSDETRTGKCSPSRVTDLQAVLQPRRTIRSLTDKFQNLHLVAHRIVPAEQSGLRLVFSSLVGGSYHIFTLGWFNQTQIHVFSSDTSEPSMLHSNYQYAWPDTPDDYVAANFDGEIRAKKFKFDDDRVLQINSSDDLVIEAKSLGCTLIAVYREL